MKTVSKTRLGLAICFVIFAFIASVFGTTLLSTKSLNQPSLPFVSADDPAPTVPTAPTVTGAWTDGILTTDIWANGNGTLANPFQIHTAKDLAIIAYKVTLKSSAENLDGLHFKLMANIDLTGKNWTPIGNASTARNFMGRLNGNGFKIQNLTIVNSSANSYLGLFGYAVNAELTNVVIEDAYIATVSQFGGILVARATGLTATDCKVIGDSYIKATTYASYTGGLIGYISSVTPVMDSYITRCENYAYVDAAAYAGGVAGVVYNTTFTDCINYGYILCGSSAGTSYAYGSNGGIVGYALTESSFSGCENRGRIDSINGYVGGIAGRVTGVTDFDDCHNFAAIKALVNTNTNYMGGIVGSVENEAQFITNCTNNARIEGRQYIGGIGGNVASAPIADCTNAITAPIVAYYGNAAGIVARLANGSIDNVVNNGAIEGSYEPTGTIASAGIVSLIAGNTIITDAVNNGAVKGGVAGGIVGTLDVGTLDVSDTENNGVITGATLSTSAASRSAAGIVAYISASGGVTNISDSNNNAMVIGYRAGGILGAGNHRVEETITNCQNFLPIGDASFLGEYTGGIVGWTNADIEMRECINHARVARDGNYVGGLIGYSLSEITKVIQSFNYGEVYGRDYVGGLIGRGSAIVTQSNNENKITATGNYVGGLIGYGITIQLDRAINKGAVSSTLNYVGGLIGNGTGIITIDDCSNEQTVTGNGTAVGGLVGYATNSIAIRNSTNLRAVMSDLVQVGGIIGYINASIEISVNMDNVKNYGNVFSNKATNDITNASGGLIGHVTATNGSFNLNNVHNYGNVAGQVVGGLVGTVTANLSFIITNSHNEGIVTATAITGYTAFAGGIAYNAFNMELVNVNNVADVTATTGAGGLIYNSHNLMVIRNSFNAGTIKATNAAGYNLAGLVASTQTSGSTMYSVSIIDSYNIGQLVLVNGAKSVGGLVGLGVNVSIQNSHNEASLDFTGQTVEHIGGLLGYIMSSTYAGVNIENSYNVADIKAFSTVVGGLVGYVQGGVNHIVTMNKSFNTGNVINQNLAANQAGGLVGRVNYGYRISNSFNTGDVTAFISGGIVGYSLIYISTPAANQPEIRNTYNRGNVTSQNGTTSVAGGIVGLVEFASGSPVVAELSITLLYVYSTGSITVASGTATLGGLIGKVIFYNNASVTTETIELTYSYFIKEVSGINTNVNLIGAQTLAGAKYVEANNFSSAKTPADMKMKGTFDGAWDFVGTGADGYIYWGINDIYNDGFPYLRNIVKGQVNTYTNYGDDAKIADYVVLVGGNVLPTSLDIPTRMYYAFSGWNTASNGSGDTILSTGSAYEMKKETLNLYAQWTSNEFMIALEGGYINLYEANKTSVVIDRRVIIGTDRFLIADAVNAATTAFVNWAVWISSSDTWVNLAGTRELALGGLIDESFLDAYLYTELGTKTLKFKAVYEAASVLTITNGTPGWGSVRLGGATYTYNTAVSFALNATVVITPTAAKYYRFVKFTVQYGAGSPVDYNGVAPLALTDATVNVVAIFEAQPYAIEFYAKTQDSNVNNLNVDTFLLGSINDITVVKDGTLTGINASISEVGYRFVNFTIINPLTGLPEVMPGQYEVLNFDFTSVRIDKFADPSTNVIKIIAVYIKQFKIDISVISVNSGSGEVSANERLQSGFNKPIGFLSEVYFDMGTIIELFATPDYNSVFEGFGGDVTSNEISDALLVIELLANRVITATFELSNYVINVYTVDSKDKFMDISDMLTIEVITSSGLQLVGVSDTITEISRVAQPGYDVLEDWVFTGWYFLKGETLIPMSSVEGITFDSVTGDVNSFAVDYAFLLAYGDDGNVLNIIAKFNNIFLVDIAIPAQFSAMGTYELYRYNDLNQRVLVNNETTLFENGTKLTIKAKITNITYYTFDGFDGRELTDSLSVDGMELTFTLSVDIGERVITLLYSSVPLALNPDMITTNAKGEVEIGSLPYKVGSDLVITFKTQSGYEIKDWFITDKSNVKHNVKDLLSLGASLRGNQLQVKVTETWLNQFGWDFKSEIVTMMNSTFLSIIMVLAVAIPLLLALILIFILLNSKKKKQAALSIEKSRQGAARFDQNNYINQVLSDSNKE